MTVSIVRAFTLPVALPFALGFATLLPQMAFAQSSSATPSAGTPASTNSAGEYVPPQGEPIEFGKKFRPTEPNADFVFELNPLMLVRRGLSVETEKKMADGFTLGVDFVYRNAEVYDEVGVEGRVKYIGASPKFRFYPMGALGGIFVGGKVFLGSHTLSVEQGDTKSSKDVFTVAPTVAPTVHVGYRFTSFGGFTLAGYVGGGINLSEPEIETSDLDASKRNEKAWQNAKKDVNKDVGLFQPDFGLTLGIAI